MKQWQQALGSAQGNHVQQGMLHAHDFRADVPYGVHELRAGLRVVAVARRKDKLEQLQAHMHALGVPPSHFLPVVCDITKDAEVGGCGGGRCRGCWDA